VRSEVQDAVAKGGEKADPAPVAAAKAAARPAPKRKAGLSQKEERRLAELEAAMDQLHARIAQLETALGDPGAFITADAPGHQALRERDAAQAGLEQLELEWLSLEEKRGSD